MGGTRRFPKLIPPSNKGEKKKKRMQRRVTKTFFILCVYLFGKSPPKGKPSPIKKKNRCGPRSSPKNKKKWEKFSVKKGGNSDSLFGGVFPPPQIFGQKKFWNKKLSPPPAKSLEKNFFPLSWKDRKKKKKPPPHAARPYHQPFPSAPFLNKGKLLAPPQEKRSCEVPPPRPLKKFKKFCFFCLEGKKNPLKEEGDKLVFGLLKRGFPLAPFGVKKFIRATRKPNPPLPVFFFIWRKKNPYQQFPHPFKSPPPPPFKKI